MTRRLSLFLLTLLMLTGSAVARDRAVSKPENGDAAMLAGKGATVSGIVERVSGNTVTLAGGLVTLDATGAKIVGPRGETESVMAIQPGSMIHAIVRAGEVGANAPIPTTLIAVTRRSDIVLSGEVQAVDRTAQTLTILGRTIRVTPQTSFGNFLHGRTGASLADVQPNMYVAVEADSVNGALVASSVMLLMPVIERPSIVSGTVKSIATGSWVITDSRGTDQTFVVNANTKIIGSPSTGDKVEVLYNVDSAHAKIAVSIIKHVAVPMPVTFEATVKSIGATEWVLTKSDNSEVRVKITGKERIEPGIVAGDKVHVVAVENADHTLTVMAIVKARR